jgi:DnaK suppressor protein
MKSYDINEIRDVLIQWLADFSNSSEETIFKFKEASDNLADTLDRAAMQSERDYNLNKLGRADLKKNNILKALRKIDEGSYGICEECEEDISIKRLKAIPDTRYCIVCQTALEKGEALSIA